MAITKLNRKISSHNIDFVLKIKTKNKIRNRTLITWGTTFARFFIIYSPRLLMFIYYTVRINLKVLHRKHLGGYFEKI